VLEAAGEVPALVSGLFPDHLVVDASVEDLHHLGAQRLQSRPDRADRDPHPAGSLRKSAAAILADLMALKVR
jgi:hypothetical protein